jgi:uncharacterized protein
MRIDLTVLGPEGVRASETFDPRDLEQEVGSVRDALWEPVLVELESWVRPERRYVRASGSYKAEARAECDRCLKPVLENVTGEFDLLYRWPDAAGRRSGRGDEHELREEDLSVCDLDGSVLDTRDIAREQIELAAPIQTLCSATCAGLCPVCGLDRNLGLCECAAEEPDRRWEGLRNLKMKDER